MIIKIDIKFLGHEGCFDASPLQAEDGTVADVLCSQPMPSLRNVHGIEFKCVMRNQYGLSFPSDDIECLAKRGMSFRVRCCEPDPDESVYMHIYLDGEPQWHVAEPEYSEIELALEGPDLDLNNDRVVLVWRSTAWLCFSRRGEEFDVSCGTLGQSCKSGAVSEDVYAAMGCGTPLGRVIFIDDGAELGTMFSASGVVTTSDMERVTESGEQYR